MTETLFACVNCGRNWPPEDVIGGSQCPDCGGETEPSAAEPVATQERYVCTKCGRRHWRCWVIGGTCPNCYGRVIPDAEVADAVG